jgi:DNA polymerase III sliding clamp (beta) subunit (PCNA family)
MKTRYVLNSIYLECRKRKPVRMVATDGRRLAIVTLEIIAEEDYSIIIPKLAIDALLTTLQGRTEIIALSVIGETIRLWGGRSGVVIESKLISANYPNFDQVLREPLPTTVPPTDQLALNAELFASSAKVLAQLSDDRACYFGQYPFEEGGQVVWWSRDRKLIVAQMPMRVS